MLHTMFTRQEVMLMESKTSPSWRVEPDENSPDQSLVLKLGIALTKADDVLIYFTPDELWILRERLSVFDRVGSEPAGLTAKTKIYTLLSLIENGGNVQVMEQEDAREAAEHSTESNAAQGEGTERITDSEKADQPGQDMPSTDRADNSKSDATGAVDAV